MALLLPHRGESDILMRVLASAIQLDMPESQRLECQGRRTWEPDRRAPGTTGEPVQV